MSFLPDVPDHPDVYCLLPENNPKSWRRNSVKQIKRTGVDKGAVERGAIQRLEGNFEKTA